MYIDILSVQKQISIRKCVCGIQKKKRNSKKGHPFRMAKKVKKRRFAESKEKNRMKKRTTNR